MKLTLSDGREVHVNPYMICVAHKDIDIEPCIETAEGGTWGIDEASYERVVEWMERQDG